MTPKRAGKAVGQRFKQSKSPKNTAAFSKALIKYAQGCEDGVKRNNKWTEKETKRLKSLKSSFEKDSDAANIDFDELARKHLPNRSWRQVYDKWISLEGKNTPKGHWLEADDNQLIQLHKKHGSAWGNIGEEMTPKRAGKAVRQRFSQAKSTKSTASFSKALIKYAREY